MARTIFGTLGGLVIGLLIIMGVESLSHIIYPPPAGVDLKDPEQLKALMSSVPLGAKLGVLIAWGLGVFGGGTAAVLFTGRKRLAASFVAAVSSLGRGGHTHHDTSSALDGCWGSHSDGFRVVWRDPFRQT